MSQSEPKNNARKCDQEPPTFCDDSSIFGWLPSPPPSHNGDLLGEYEQIEEDPSVTSKSPQPSSMESLRGLSFEKMATKGSDCNDSPRVSSECLLVRYEWLQTGLGHHQAAKVTHRGTLPYQHSQRHRSTTRTPSTPRQNSLKSNKGDCKRRRDGDDSGDDGDGGNKRRVQPVQLLETSALPLRWACPFQKFDPEGESRCSLEFCGFVEIWDVKRHLMHRHRRSNRCRRCWMLFDVEIAEDNSLLLRHEREGSCFQRPSLEKYFVSEDEVLRLDQVSCEDPTTLWYKWLRILVPRLQHESIEALKEMFTPWFEEPRNAGEALLGTPSASTSSLLKPAAAVPGYITPGATPQLTLSERPVPQSWEWNSFIPGWLERVGQTSEPQLASFQQQQQPADGPLPLDIPDMSLSSIMEPTPVSTAPFWDGPRPRRHPGIDRQQNYIEQLRSEIRSLKTRRAETREGIENVINMLYRGLDFLSTQGTEDAEHHVQDAIDTLVSLLPDLPRRDASNSK